MNSAHAPAAFREAAPFILAPGVRLGVPPAGLPADQPVDWPAGIWRADTLAGPCEAVLSTGEAALDAALPGGGWPVGALTELLLPQPHAHVWRLLTSGLARALARQAGPVVLVAPPQVPFVPSLAAQGLPASRWLRVDADKSPARLWATEQALRCAEVAAVLAWLPGAEPADLRRLQLAAQRHQQLLFVMRPLSARTQASPARLRLVLEEDAAEREILRVHVLKRRGPPLAVPVRMPAQPPLLLRLLRSRRRVLGPVAPHVRGGALGALGAVSSLGVPAAPAASISPTPPSPRTTSAPA